MIPSNAPTVAPIAAPVDRFDGLTALKFAQITQCDKKGVPIPDSATVRAILTEGDLAIESQYQTPFGNSNPEMKLPSLMALLQSGDLAEGISQGTKALENGGDGAKLVGAVVGVAGIAANALSQSLGFKDIRAATDFLEGRTTLTKVNSTEIFLSTEPVTLNLTLFFMAFKDARVEDDDKVRQLEMWALPQSLKEFGAAVNIAKSVENKEGLVSGLFSGVVPPFVSLTYGGKTYKPMLIQSVSKPLVAPIDSKGNRLNLTVQITLVSRTAWDASNIDAVYRG